MGTAYQGNQKKGLRPYVHKSKRRGSAERAGVDIRDVPKVEPGNYSLLLLLNQALSYRLSPTNKDGEPNTEWVQTEPRSTLRLVAGTIQPTGTDEPRRILPTGKFARAAFLWLMLATAKHQSPKISVSSFLDFLYKFYASGAANFTPEQEAEAIEQLHALLAVQVEAVLTGPAPDGNLVKKTYRFALSSSADWVYSASGAPLLNESTIVLAQPFYNHLATFFVVTGTGPALIQLADKTQSPFTLDALIWFSHFTYQARLAQRSIGPVSWEQLREMFAPDQTDTRFLKRVKASAFELAKLDKLMMLSAEVLEGRGEYGPVHGLIFHPVPCDAFHKSVIDSR